MLYRLSLHFGIIESGILPKSAAAKCIWRWERYFRWLRTQARQAGFTVANRNNLIRYKTSDTLFILGSGPSINAISEEEWKVIAQHNSIGFNYFLAHPFVPTYYHMELRPEDMEMFRGCYSQRRDAYRNIPFMINYHFIMDDFNSADLDFIDNKLITVPRLYTDCRAEDVEKIFHFNHKYVAPSDNYFLLHYRGSLCLMISLGVLLGYKKIVLAGVDLKDSTYFYCDERYACAATQALVRNRCQTSTETATTLHATADPSFIPSTVTIDRVLQLLNEIALKKRGIEFFVYNKKSLLHPTFPVWNGN
jgi:hypothetical protein